MYRNAAKFLEKLVSGVGVRASEPRKHSLFVFLAQELHFKVDLKQVQ